MNVLRKTVSGVMSDFSKKITALKKIQKQQNADITENTKKIKELKAANYEAQSEISAAQKAINAMENIVGGL